MAGTYSTDLTLIAAGDGTDSAPTEFNAYNAGGTFGTNDADNFIQGTSAFVALTPTQANRGNSIVHNEGSTVSIAAGDVLSLWGNFSVPGILASTTDNPPGAMVGVGTSTTAISTYIVDGADTYYEGGWRNYVVDLRNTPTGPDNTGDTGTAGAHANQYFGMVYYQTGDPTRASPYNLDGIRYGRMIMTCNGGDNTSINNASPLSSSAGNFPQMADYDDYNAGGTPTFGSAVDGGYHRFAQTRFLNGAYVCQGIIRLGSAGSPNQTYFNDSNRTVVFKDCPLTYADFNRIEIRNSASTVVFDSMTFSALGTTARGNFEMVDNATLDIDGCSFLDMGTFIFQSNASVDDTAFRRCNLITAGGATFTNCTFSRSNNSTAVSSSTTADFLSCTFISTGTGYAIDLGTINTDTTMTSSSIFTGYDAGTDANGGTGGNANSAILVNVANSGDTLTINVSTGASSPSVNNTGPGSVVVQQTVNFIIRNIIADSSIRIIEDQGGGTLVDLGGVDNVAASPSGETSGFVTSSDELNNGKYKVVYSYTYTSDKNIFLVAQNFDYQHIYDSYTLGNTEQTARVSQITDRQYDPGSV